MKKKHSEKKNDPELSPRAEAEDGVNSDAAEGGKAKRPQKKWSELSKKGKKRRLKRIGRKILIFLRDLLFFCLKVAFLAALVYGASRYVVLTEGQFHLVTATSLDLRGTGVTTDEELVRYTRLKKLDLRGNGLTVDEYYALLEDRPDLYVRWDIPIGGTTYDNQTEDLVFEDIPEDIENLQLFDGVKSVTVTHPSDRDAVIALAPELEAQGITTEWNVYFNGDWYPSGTTELTIPAGEAPVDELISVTDYLPVEKVVFEGPDLDTDTQLMLLDRLPGVDFVWQVVIAGKAYRTDTETLSFDAVPDLEELEEALTMLPGVKTIVFEDGCIDVSTQLKLLDMLPDMRFEWDVVINGTAYSTKTTALGFKGEAPDMEELEEALKLLPDLKSVDFDGSGVSAEDRCAFRADHPELDVTWNVTLLGETYSNDVTYLDLNSYTLENTDELRAALPYMPDLEKVDMNDCGIPDEDMRTLADDFPSVHFIWTIYFGNYYLRTDATYFIPSAWENGCALYNVTIAPIRYCTDLVALDLGHTYVEDLSFLQYMPHLKYLILVDSSVNDISYVSYCKELTYLEAYVLHITDFSPLLECPNLTDLNIGYTRSTAEAALEVFSQMPQLERLWYCCCPFNAAQKEQLIELLPDCEFYWPPMGQSTGSTWRYHEHYYEMRDAFEMYYMPGNTAGVDVYGNQIIIDDWDTTIVLYNWDLTQKWFELAQYKNINWHFAGINCWDYYYYKENMPE